MVTQLPPCSAPAQHSGQGMGVLNQEGDLAPAQSALSSRLTQTEGGRPCAGPLSGPTISRAPCQPPATRLLTASEPLWGHSPLPAGRPHSVPGTVAGTW